MKNLLHLTKQLAVLFFFAGLVSCANTEKLLEQGNYEKLVKVVLKKVKGKKNIKTKHVLVLEQGFNEMQARDLGRINHMRDNGQLQDWEKMNALAKDIKYRQNVVQPYLPIIAEDGYKANFNFMKIEPIIAESADQAAKLLYNQAIDQLVIGREGDKLSARNAYYSLNNLNKYAKNYLSSAAMKVEAKKLGITRVWLDMENASNAFLPSGFEQDLLSLNFRNLQNDWTEFYVRPSEKINFDYKAVLNITNIDVSPEQVYEHEDVRCKTIQDGWIYFKDTEGNYLVDSLGNKLKEPKMIEVRGSVVTTELTKAAIVRGRMDLIDMRKRAVVESRPIESETVFNHLASRYFGDTRALTTTDCRIIPLVGFPSDIEMILRTADDLKPRFIRELQACRLI